MILNCTKSNQVYLRLLGIDITLIEVKRFESIPLVKLVCQASSVRSSRTKNQLLTGKSLTNETLQVLLAGPFDWSDDGIIGIKNYLNDLIQTIDAILKQFP